MTVTENTSTDTDAGRRDAAPRSRKRVNWFAAFWRWHFYGAVLVIPVLLVLTTTGLTYMYRAQIDAWTHPGVLTVTAPDGAERLPLSQQEDAVREAFPDRDILSVVDHTGDRSTVFVTTDSDNNSNNDGGGRAATSMSTPTAARSPVTSRRPAWSRTGPNASTAPC